MSQPCGQLLLYPMNLTHVIVIRHTLVSMWILEWGKDMKLSLDIFLSIRCWSYNLLFPNINWILQLLPCNVHKIRTCLLSSNSLVDLQTMVMTMVTICLFFSINDLYSMTIEHFISEQFVFDPAGNIMGICKRLSGKDDADWFMLTFWMDDECPEFCPVCLLLVYIHVTKIQGGCLFPSELELLNPPSDGVFVAQISYSVLQVCMTLLVEDVLGLSGLSAQVGLLLILKTGYLWHT